MSDPVQKRVRRKGGIGTGGAENVGGNIDAPSKSLDMIFFYFSHAVTITHILQLVQYCTHIKKDLHTVAKRNEHNMKLEKRGIQYTPGGYYGIPGTWQPSRVQTNY